MPRLRLLLRWRTSNCSDPIDCGGCWAESKAESLDRLVEEGVQILKEKHEIVHLQVTRQLDVRQLKRISGQQATVGSIHSKAAAAEASRHFRTNQAERRQVLANLQRKWAAEGLPLRK